METEKEPPKDKGKGKKSEGGTIFSGKTKIEIDVQRYLIGGVIITLFLGFIGLMVAVDAILVDGFRSRETTYQDLKEEISKQNDKIDNLNTIINLVCRTWRKDCPTP